MLVKHLPRDAATWGHTAWTQADEFAATAIEVADAWGRAHYALLHLLVTRKPPPRSQLEPIRIEHPDRPGAKPAEVEHDPAVIKAFFEKF